MHFDAIFAQNFYKIDSYTKISSRISRLTRKIFSNFSSTSVDVVKLKLIENVFGSRADTGAAKATSANALDARIAFLLIRVACKATLK